MAETISAYWWVGLLAIVVLLVLLYRQGSFRVAAKGPGGALEIEGHGRVVPAPEPGPGKNEAIAPRVQSVGSRSVAIGGNAERAQINTGDQDSGR